MQRSTLAFRRLKKENDADEFSRHDIRHIFTETRRRAHTTLAHFFFHFAYSWNDGAARKPTKAICYIMQS